MRRHPTLCIVDMQPRFEASQDPSTMAAVLDLISRARKVGAAIVVLEYEGEGPTDERIIKALKGYPRYQVTEKWSNDGSEEFLDACMQRGFYTGAVLVCGVNTNACVAETVFGLKNRLPCKSRVLVIGKACNTFIDRDVALSRLRTTLLKGYKNVRVVMNLRKEYL